MIAAGESDAFLQNLDPNLFLCLATLRLVQLGAKLLNPLQFSPRIGSAFGARCGPDCRKRNRAGCRRA